MKIRRALLVLALFALQACAAVTPAVSPATETVPAPRASSTPEPPPATMTPQPSGTPLPTTAVELPVKTSEPAPSVCSPLQGYALEDLPGMVSNPYHPPATGSDMPHQGVDLAIRLPGSEVAMPGSPVTAALPGRVSAVFQDRFPYGTAVLLETPLELAPLEWQARAGIPEPAPTLASGSALTCPPFVDLPAWDESRRSLYVLYAHLQQADPALRVGQQVECGQPVGLVGESGNALNPHLHFEARVGPAGYQPGSMAHYDASATQQEMAVYCLWRVSGRFQLVDPLVLLGAAP